MTTATLVRPTPAVSLKLKQRRREHDAVYTAFGALDLTLPSAEQTTADSGTTTDDFNGTVTGLPVSTRVAYWLELAGVRYGGNYGTTSGAGVLTWAFTGIPVGTGYKFVLAPAGHEELKFVGAAFNVALGA